VNTIVVLMGLLFLSYLGTLLASGSKLGGLPSSSEFLVIGVIAGPVVLGAMTQSSLETFDPIAYVAAGWLALSSGLEYGYAGSRRVSAGRLITGIVLTLACGGLVSAVTWLVAPQLVVLTPGDRLLLAGGVGCVCAESSRHGIEWLIRRDSAHGAITSLLRDLSHSDEVVPIAGVALLYALRPPVHATVHLPPLGWAGITLAMGVLLGALTALLLARDHRVAESWGTLLGTSLMTIGLAARLDLAALTAMFALGATIAWFSRHGSDIRGMVHTTERAVVLPALVLAGGRVDPATLGGLVYLIPIALVVRIVVKLVAGLVLRLRGPARTGSALLGLGLVSSGGMSILIGLMMALRFPGRIGDTILGAAVAVTIAGELTGPVFLRRILGRAGEIPEPEPPEVESIEDSMESGGTT
jgi:hypothetical protein